MRGVALCCAAKWHISHPARNVSQRGPPFTHTDRYPLLCFIGYFKLGDSYSNVRQLCALICACMCVCVCREREFKQPSLSGFCFSILKTSGLGSLFRLCSASIDSVVVNWFSLMQIKWRKGWVLVECRFCTAAIDCVSGKSMQGRLLMSFAGILLKKKWWHRLWESLQGSDIWHKSIWTTRVS